MNKYLLTTALVIASVSTAYAVAPSQTVTTMEKKTVTERTMMPTSNVMVSLGGDMRTEGFYNSQKRAFDRIDYLDQDSAKVQKHGIANDTRVHVKLDGNSHGMKYGGKVTINADTSSSKFAPRNGVDNNRVGYQTMMYLESKFGRMEAGSTTGVYESMKANAGTMARATGGINGDTRYVFNQDFANGSIDTGVNGTAVRGQFVVAPSLPTNYDNYTVANAAKVTLRTPTWSGFNMGVTFIPNTEQHGTLSNYHNVSRNTFNNAGGTASSFRTSGYRNVFQAAIGYSGKFDKNYAFKIAATGEIGKAKDYNFNQYNTVVPNIAIPVPTANVNASAKRHKLKAWEVGAAMMFNGFTVGGSYGDWGRSGLIKETTVSTVANPITQPGVANVVTTTSIASSKKTKYWTAGLGYDYKQFGSSVTYMSSSSTGFAKNLFANNSYDGAKAKYKVVSVGLDYKLAPGFKPFAEYSHYSLKDKAEVVAGMSRNSGNVILFGSDLYF